MEQSTQSSDHLIQTNRVTGIAAAFKGVFSIDWIQELTGAKASTILSVLNEGVRAGWISCDEDGFYIFVDEEIRSTLWRLIPKEEQPRVQEQAAEIVSRELSEAGNLNPALVDPPESIRNTLDGCRKLVEIGDRSRLEFRFEDAQRFYRKVFTNLMKWENAEANRLFTETAIKYSKISTPASNSNQVVETIREAIRRARMSDLKPNLALLHMHLAKQEWLLSNYQEVFEHFNQGWAIVRQIEDPVLKRSAGQFNVFFKYWQGRFRELVSDFEASAPVISDLPKTDISMLTNLTIGSSLGYCGHVFQGIGMIDIIRRRGRKAGNINISSHASAAISEFLSDLKRYDVAIGYYKEAIDETIQGQNIFIRVMTLLGMANAHIHMGDKKEALELLQEYHTLSRQHKILEAPFAYLMEICLEMEEEVQTVITGISFASEIQRAMKSKNVYMKGMAHYYLALSNKRKGQPAEVVIDLLRKAIAYLEESGHRIGLENAKLELARSLDASNQKDEARQLAESAVRALFALDPNLVPQDFESLIAQDGRGQETLAEILLLGKKQAASANPEEIADAVISTVIRQVRAERGAVFLIEQSTGQLRLIAAKNLTIEDVADEGFGFSVDFIRKAVSTGEMQVFQSDFDGGSSEPGHSLHAMLCIPLQVNGRGIGVLYTDNRICRNTAPLPDPEILTFYGVQAALSLGGTDIQGRLRDRLQEDYEQKRYRKALYSEALHFEGIIGRSRAINVVFSQIDAVADTESAVLILGETGVGKELVARAIHNNSNRRQGPFIRVNCSALTENLVSSELFGHEKGSFTGAVDQRVGRFELANGGTLFLDEIGDISQTTQLQLLRVLQTKEFERVGGQKTILSDFRLMAATNKNLQREIKAGRFRTDLYYRLNIFPINVPPLRERKEDIPLLAQHFLNAYTEKLGREMVTIEDDILEKLKRYDWPGNVRELENYIERGAILSRDNRFYPPVDELEQAAQPVSSQKVALQDIEREHILNILNQTKGRIAGRGGAAEILEIHPNTLRYRLKKLNIHIDRRGYHVMEE